MLEEILSSIVYLYIRACFANADLDTLERAELEKLVEWNRGLARGMLWPGVILLLPLTLALLVFLGLFLSGQVFLGGWEVEVCLAACIGALTLAHVLLLGLLIALCFTRLEWEPLGFVLALADVLGTTPRVLQNCWRVLVCLPLVAFILLLCLS